MSIDGHPPDHAIWQGTLCETLWGDATADNRKMLDRLARRGYLAALELTVPGSDDPVAAALVVNDGEGGDPAVYLIPPDLLLEGPNGEYVFAGDAMASGTFEEDLERILAGLLLDLVEGAVHDPLGD